MKRTILTVVALAGWAASAACSSSSKPTTDIESVGDGGGSGSGGGRGDGGNGASPDGSISDGGNHEIPDAFPDVVVTQATDAAMGEPTCKTSMTWSQPTPVPGVDRFSTSTPPLVTMTSNELTLVWVIASSGGGGTVYIADRASTSDPFGTPSLVPGATTGIAGGFDGGAMDAGDTYFAFERVAITPDGQQLIGVALGDQHLAQFTRLGSSWEAPMEAPVSALASTLMTQFGEKLGDLVVGPSGLDLAYSHYGANATTVYETMRASNVADWEPGSGLSSAVLDEVGGQRRHPSSMTADRLTLFIWDDTDQKGYYVLRPAVGEAFNYHVELGPNFYSPQINGACTRVYYVVSSGTNQYQLVYSDGT